MVRTTKITCHFDLSGHIKASNSKSTSLALPPVTYKREHAIEVLVLCTGAGGRSRSFDLFCLSRSWSRSLFTSGKTPEALICAANYNRTSANEFMIDNYGILCCFVYHCGVYKTVGLIVVISENFIKDGETLKHLITF